MSATDVLKLTADEVQQKVNPMGLEQYFVVGSGDRQVPEILVLAELKRQEAQVLSSLPEKYRRLLGRVDGLIAVRYATAGQTTVALPLEPSGGLRVFRNFPSLFGRGMRAPAGTLKPYRDRTEADALAGCTATGGLVTLPVALASGDNVVVDFEHDGMGACEELRAVVLGLTAAEMLRGFPSASENVADKIHGWETNAMLFLRRMWSADGMKTGIQFFDRLDIVEELETRQTGGVRPLGPSMGGLL